VERIIFIACCLGAVAAGASAQELRLAGGARIVSAAEEEGVLVWDVAWDSGNALWRESRAWLVAAKGSQAAGAIFYAHMYGHGQNRDQFLPEAKADAKAGIASILVQGAVPWKASWTGTAADRELLDAQLADSMKGMALLRAQSWIDPARIVYVGHDYGAMAGAALARRDPGFRAYALLAPSPRYGDWIKYFNSSAPSDYDSVLGEDQPLRALAAMPDRPLLLQFAERDRFVPEADVLAFRQGLPRAVVQSVAGANHDSVAERGRAARMEFLGPFLAK
jgi:pimeloyl-ACP methyl ester carboxylesterase